LICRRSFSAGGTPTNEPHVLVCIGVVDFDELETGVVDPAAPRGVREDAEEVVVVLVRLMGPRLLVQRIRSPLLDLVM
jgi:hypothetical protein